MSATEFGVTVVPLDQVNEIPLPNGSWSKMVLTGDSVSGIVSSLGYSVFKPGTELSTVARAEMNCLLSRVAQVDS